MLETRVILIPLDALEKFHLKAWETPIELTACASFMLSEVYAISRLIADRGACSICPPSGGDALLFQDFMRWEENYVAERNFEEQSSVISQDSSLLKSAELVLLLQMLQCSRDTAIVVPRALHEFMTYTHGDGVYREMLGLDGTMYHRDQEGIHFHTGVVSH